MPDLTAHEIVAITSASIAASQKHNPDSPAYKTYAAIIAKLENLDLHYDYQIVKDNPN